MTSVLTHGLNDSLFMNTVIPLFKSTVLALLKNLSSFLSKSASRTKPGVDCLVQIPYGQANFELKSCVLSKGSGVRSTSNRSRSVKIRPSRPCCASPLMPLSTGFGWYYFLYMCSCYWLFGSLYLHFICLSWVKVTC